MLVLFVGVVDGWNVLIISLSFVVVERVSALTVTVASSNVDILVVSVLGLIGVMFVFVAIV